MDSDSPNENSRRFEEAIALLDAENSKDRNQIISEGKSEPRELVHSQWLTGWVCRLAPNASEALRLAARSQHIARWSIPRDTYPMTRAGYLKWKEDLKRFHAQKAGEVLKRAGYDEETIQRVQSLNLKKNLTTDPEVQVLEDALCLVFLEHQFEELAGKLSDEKMIGVLQKTWNKMSPAGRDAALKLSYSERERMLLGKALGV
jgi:hypothetical protein